MFTFPKASALIFSNLLITGTGLPDVLDDLVSIGGVRVDRGTNDTINGLAGRDIISVHNGNDTVNGGDGNDVISDNGGGYDTLNGDAGNDYFFAGTGAGENTINGGTGTDTVSYVKRSGGVTVDLTGGYAESSGSLIDWLVSIENVNGSAYGDLLEGNSAANTISGYTGDDLIYGHSGNDQLDGGAGRDRLFGGHGQDGLSGGSGNDQLSGGYGSDRLAGGRGDDVMTGGPGSATRDTFVFSSWADFDRLDIITDFQHGIDKISIWGIDARPGTAGSQAFTFDATPDGRVEEFFDGLSDDWSGLVHFGLSPLINGETGEVEYKHSGGNTFVYLSQGDGLNAAEIRLNGTIALSASDFIL